MKIEYNSNKAPIHYHNRGVYCDIPHSVTQVFLSDMTQQGADAAWSLVTNSCQLLLLMTVIYTKGYAMVSIFGGGVLSWDYWRSSHSSVPEC